MRRWLTLGVLAALLGAGCASDDRAEDAGSGRVDVVASFYPVAEAAQRVGGSCVRVENLTPAGAEPHDLELTPDQVDAIQDADAVFVMGDGFQPGVEDAAGQRDGATVSVLDDLPARGADPHVWLDPVLYSELVGVVARELHAVVPPSCQDEIGANTRAFQSEITTVNDALTTGLATCERRTIVTAHDAFSYLARRYALSQQGIAGVSPEEEPNAARLADLADVVHRNGVTTIFTETLVSPRVANALAREAGVKTETLNALEGLTDDQIARGDDWASVIRENLAKLHRALGCR